MQSFSEVELGRCSPICKKNYRLVTNLQILQQYSSVLKCKDFEYLIYSK